MHALTGRIVLSNKKRNSKKYSAVLFKAFSKKKKLFGGTCIKDIVSNKKQKLGFEMMVESSLSSILKRNGLSKISSNMSAPLRFYSINEALLLTYIP